MSDDSMDNDNDTATSSTTPDKRRSTVPDILPHQRSFEKRYSHIIHRQILETGVNKEALQRQINAYFSCGGDKNKSSEQVADEDADSMDATAAQTDNEDEQKADENQRALEKLDTLDIEEQK